MISKKSRLIIAYSTSIVLNALFWVGFSYELRAGAIPQTAKTKAIQKMKPLQIGVFQPRPAALAQLPPEQQPDVPAKHNDDKSHPNTGNSSSDGSHTPGMKKDTSPSMSSDSDETASGQNQSQTPNSAGSSASANAALHTKSDTSGGLDAADMPQDSHEVAAANALQRAEAAEKDADNAAKLAAANTSASSSAQAAAQSAHLAVARAQATLASAIAAASPSNMASAQSPAAAKPSTVDTTQSRQASKNNDKQQALRVSALHAQLPNTADSDNGLDQEGADNSTPESPGTTPPPDNNKPVSNLVIKQVQMWSPKPGQKFNLATNLNITFPADFKVVAGPPLTDEQMAQIEELMRHQHLLQVRMTKEQVQHLADVRRRTTSKPKEPPTPKAKDARHREAKKPTPHPAPPHKQAAPQPILANMPRPQSPFRVATWDSNIMRRWAPRSDLDISSSASRAMAKQASADQANGMDGTPASGNNDEGGANGGGSPASAGGDQSQAGGQQSNGGSAGSNQQANASSGSQGGNDGAATQTNNGAGNKNGQHGGAVGTGQQANAGGNAGGAQGGREGGQHGGAVGTGQQANAGGNQGSGQGGHEGGQHGGAVGTGQQANGGGNPGGGQGGHEGGQHGGAVGTAQQANGGGNPGGGQGGHEGGQHGGAVGTGQQANAGGNQGGGQGGHEGGQHGGAIGTGQQANGGGNPGGGQGGREGGQHGGAVGTGQEANAGGNHGGGQGGQEGGQHGGAVGTGQEANAGGNHGGGQGGQEGGQHGGAVGTGQEANAGGNHGGGQGGQEGGQHGGAVGTGQEANAGGNQGGGQGGQEGGQHGGAVGTGQEANAGGNQGGGQGGQEGGQHGGAVGTGQQANAGGNQGGAQGGQHNGAQGGGQEADAGGDEGAGGGQQGGAMGAGGGGGQHESSGMNGAGAETVADAGMEAAGVVDGDGGDGMGGNGGTTNPNDPNEQNGRDDGYGTGEQTEQAELPAPPLPGHTVPGALALPPAPPVGTEKGTDPTPHKVRMAVIPPPPSNAFADQVYKVTWAAKSQTRVVQNTDPRKATKVPVGLPTKTGPKPILVALTVGSVSLGGQVPMTVMNRPHLPMGTPYDVIDPPQPPAKGTPKSKVTVKMHSASLALFERPAEEPAPTQKPVPMISSAPTSNLIVFAHNSHGVKDGSETPLPPTPLPDSNALIGDGSGLKGDYYEGPRFDQFVFSRADPNVDYDWISYPTQSPGPGIVAYSDYTVRWTGRIVARYSETYTFYAAVDDGVRVWINHKLVLDDWAAHSLSQFSNQFTFQAGEQYLFKCEYLEVDGGGASVYLYWESPHTPKQYIPEDAFFYPLPSDEKELKQDTATY